MRRLRSRKSVPAGVVDRGGLHILRIADVPKVATAGMSGYMLSSAAEIERRGHRVAFWFRDQLAPSVTGPGLRRLLVPWLIAAKVIAAVSRGAAYDIVEIHEPLAAPYAIAARLLGSRLPVCVALSHGLEERAWQAQRDHLSVYGRKPSLRSRVLVPSTLLLQARIGLRMAEAVLVLSSADRNYLIDRVRLPGQRVSLAFTGVSERLFETPRRPAADVRLLFLGSWIERKGTLELVEAWRMLAAERPGVRLTLAGVGNGHRARDDMRGLPRVDVMETIGRDELPALLAQHEIFVLASWFEGLPLSMLEAAAAELACVVCALCGNLDVFRPDDPQQDGALLVPPSDAKALHRALVTLVDDARLRRALGVNARRRARRFTWASNADQTLSAYSAALARRRAVESALIQTAGAS